MLEIGNMKLLVNEMLGSIFTLQLSPQTPSHYHRKKKKIFSTFLFNLQEDPKAHYKCAVGMTCRMTNTV